MSFFNGKKVLMMAGGTGGHVYPALTIAKALQEQGATIEWLGNEDKFEGKHVPKTGFKFNHLDVNGLRGNGAVGWIKAPFMLLKSIAQAKKIIKRFDPDLVIGMGGFASGPGGVAAKLMGKKLIIHEQNAVMGMTNRYLSKLANIVLVADEHAVFPSIKKKAQVVGNPVRKGLKSIHEKKEAQPKNEIVKLLVLGGSQGAQFINQLVPNALSLIEEKDRPNVVHQCGERNFLQTVKTYDELEIEAEVVPFIEDMEQAYQNADWVISRSGALSVAELTVAGIPALFIPFPYAVDDHQTKNAQFLIDASVCDLYSEKELTPEILANYIKKQNIDDLIQKSNKIVQLSQPNAEEKILKIIEGMMCE